MGSEIRRVPADWEHPRKEDGQYQPLFDESYEDAASQWQDEQEQWTAGTHPDQLVHSVAPRFFWDWDGPPPDSDFYRARAWSPEEATHYQVYETASEGTPVTPVLASPEEVVDHLSTNGMEWDATPWDRAAAERFVGVGWAPTAVAVGGRVYRPSEMTPAVLGTKREGA